ncbi:aldo/keto reductase [Sphingorhabdus sp.]|jgi:aryl-alcohol dehydrogenase-like predicted oxidoreductase|uniref:aldo/keto reductase n=1 Tax=Sphingorhabdus sp. TaxID=1902408 RepID=UPI0040471198
MEHRRIGKSAIYVCDICMGTMTFGSQTDEAQAHRILDKCLDAGINFFDTAEGYPVPPDIKWVGRTEDIVGRWMKGKNRDAIIMATRVSGPSHTWFKSPKRGCIHLTATISSPRLRRACADCRPIMSTCTRRIGPTTASLMTRRWKSSTNWYGRARCAYWLVRMRQAAA